MTEKAVNSNAEGSPSGLGADLLQALERSEFFLVYQPTIDLRTNGFAGVEALLRWRHVRRGVVNPDEFIDELEASGQILPVGRWTLDTACLQGTAWHDRGYRFPVSVNVAASQLDSAQFVSDVEEALRMSRFDRALLLLEFSQSTIVDDRSSAQPKIKELRELGVRIAVDDFVPGTSSLDDLVELGVSTLKLDRGFVGSISNSPDAPSLIHELVQQSKERHVQIIASGIEDAQQRSQLQLEDVGVGQGYLFSEPHEAEAIDLLLEDFAIFSGKPL